MLADVVAICPCCSLGGQGRKIRVSVLTVHEFAVGEARFFSGHLPGDSEPAAFRCVHFNENGRDDRIKPSPALVPVGNTRGSACGR